MVKLFMNYKGLLDIIETKEHKLHSTVLPYALDRSFDLTKKYHVPCGKCLSIASFFNNYHLQGGEFIKTQSEAQKNGRRSFRQALSKDSIVTRSPAKFYYHKTNFILQEFDRLIDSSMEHHAFAG
jgi:hypothetical protein